MALGPVGNVLWPLLGTPRRALVFLMGLILVVGFSAALMGDVALTSEGETPDRWIALVLFLMLAP